MPSTMLVRHGFYEVVKIILTCVAARMVALDGCRRGCVSHGGDFYHRRWRGVWKKGHCRGWHERD